MDSPGYGDATFGRFRLQPGRDVHTIAVKIAVVDDDISQMQANAEDYATIFGLVTVGLKNGLLELDGGLEGVNGARELGQGPVAGEFDQATTMTCQRRLEALLAVRL